MQFSYQAACHLTFKSPTGIRKTVKPWNMWASDVPVSRTREVLQCEVLLQYYCM